MKKVAIVTLYHKNYNFGGQLQAYALQKVVESYGFDCKVVDYIPENNLKKKIKVFSLKTIIPRVLSKCQMKFHLMTNKKLLNGVNNKKILFNKFMDMIPHTSEYDKETFSEICNSFDYWIVGSDQVWNPKFLNGYDASIYLLESVTGKKIAYAASSGIPIYTEEQKKILKKALPYFSAISLREIWLSNAISDIISKQTSVVLDPTLLLDSVDWYKLTLQPRINDKFAFVYLVLSCDDTKKNIYDYCKKNGLKMVIVPHAQNWYKSADEKYYDVQALEIGPKEWLGYIKNAEVIFTDSFHATAFSINFHKKFLSFEYLSDDENKNNCSRKYSLLNQLGLLNRCVPYDLNMQDYNIIESDIDYTSSDEKLNMLRSFSENFLKTALDVKE